MAPKEIICADLTRDDREMLLPACPDCGKPMQGTRQSYHYKECGLSSVRLLNTPVFHCACGFRSPEIKGIVQLHSLIAYVILTKPTLLSGEEIRFLRRVAGLSQAELAEIVGCAKTRLSKWENERPPIGKESDRVLRTFCLMGMFQHLFAEKDRAGMRELSLNKAIRQLDVCKLLKSIRARHEGAVQVKAEPVDGQDEDWFLPNGDEGRTSIRVIMNRLSNEDRARLVAAHCEGCSIRSTVRLTGIAKNTVVKLLVELGAKCAAYLDEHVVNVRAERVQVDEIWSYVRAKAKNTKPEHFEGEGYAGDVWTFTSIEADKLVINLDGRAPRREFRDRVHRRSQEAAGEPRAIDFGRPQDVLAGSC